MGSLGSTLEIRKCNHEATAYEVYNSRTCKIQKAKAYVGFLFFFQLTLTLLYRDGYILEKSEKSLYNLY